MRQPLGLGPRRPSSQPDSRYALSTRTAAPSATALCSVSPANACELASGAGTTATGFSAAGAPVASMAGASGDGADCSAAGSVDAGALSSAAFLPQATSASAPSSKVVFHRIMILTFPALSRAHLHCC